MSVMAGKMDELWIGRMEWCVLECNKNAINFYEGMGEPRRTASGGAEGSGGRTTAGDGRGRRRRVARRGGRRRGGRKRKEATRGGRARRGGARRLGIAGGAADGVELPRSLEKGWQAPVPGAEPAIVLIFNASARLPRRKRQRKRSPSAVVVVAAMSSHRVPSLLARPPRAASLLARLPRAAPPRGGASTK
ncbi:hypothetical protein [Oryza sativa Japonica Group]|uniref:Uncharacterized protein P0416D03.14 n=1 Tax=Oryza sativa subsp. japonica TaxID=39947 RepID=Q9AX56_ORYSJ|nr:hypothetical protein [Oryza sativa Japonica Group]